MKLTFKMSYEKALAKALNDGCSDELAEKTALAIQEISCLKQNVASSQINQKIMDMADNGYFVTRIEVA